MEAQLAVGMIAKLAGTDADLLIEDPNVFKMIKQEIDDEQTIKRKQRILSGANMFLIDNVFSLRHIKSKEEIPESDHCGNVDSFFNVQSSRPHIKRSMQLGTCDGGFISVEKPMAESGGAYFNVYTVGNVDKLIFNRICYTLAVYFGIRDIHENATRIVTWRVDFGASLLKTPHASIFLKKVKRWFSRDAITDDDGIPLTAAWKYPLNLLLAPTVADKVVKYLGAPKPTLSPATSSVGEAPKVVLQTQLKLTLKIVDTTPAIFDELLPKPAATDSEKCTTVTGDAAGEDSLYCWHMDAASSGAALVIKRPNGGKEHHRTAELFLIGELDHGQTVSYAKAVASQSLTHREWWGERSASVIMVELDSNVDHQKACRFIMGFGLGLNSQETNTDCFLQMLVRRKDEKGTFSTMNPELFKNLMEELTDAARVSNPIP
eukprot:GHVS01067163.1.p1 GENE.GHVS01067163.1~~GHVS01067163.1.p1  ORF type:complete len:433 (-),score=40.79 GHVS01067163.1:391-1689(-)